MRTPHVSHSKVQAEMAETILGTFFSWRITGSPNSTRHLGPPPVSHLLTFRLPSSVPVRQGSIPHTQWEVRIIIIC